MKNSKKLTLVLGLAAGAVLAAVATKSTKKVKHHIAKKAPQPESGYDDSEVYYI